MTNDLFSSHSQNQYRPLAEQLRPQSLDEFVGQQRLIGPGQVLRQLLDQDRLPSMILWGPPGSGKTTLARLMAKYSNSSFHEFSAVTSSISDIKKMVEEAKARTQTTGRRTIIFVDEIHRFNKAQQDAFLPHVEAGTFTLIGATTENPSFSIIGALLSRSRVFTLEQLSETDLQLIMQRAAGKLPQLSRLTEPAQASLIRYADGDARRLLTALETVAATQSGDVIDLDQLQQMLQHKHLFYDKSGEEHFNLISALHKSLRDSDPQGTLYWLGRMLEAGEDPLFICRRLTRAAAEDIGLADPQALILASATFEAVKNIGMPESNVIIAELATYLALAPKSNALYVAYDRVRQDVQLTANQPVPLHLRNAPTKLMKDLDYGKGYQYAHNAPDAKVDQRHLPESVEGHTYYQPIRGWEKQHTEPSASQRTDKKE